MGIQIFLIVFFHFTETCVNSGVHSSWFITFFYTYVRSSGVDLFLLLSGLGLYYSWKRRPVSSVFYIKRFSRLIIPYLLVAVPSWAIYNAISGRSGLLSYFADLCFVTFFSKGEKWMWFIAMAAACYLLFPFIFNIVETARDRFDGFIRVLVLCLALTFVLLLLKLYQSDLYDNINIAISRFPAFFVGVLFGKASYGGRSVSAGALIAFVVISVMLDIPLGLANTSILGVYVRALTNLSLCMLGMYVFGSIAKSDSLLRAIPGRLFAWLGAYTLEIYMTHVVVRRFLALVGFPTYRILSELLLVALSLALSLIVAKVTSLIRPSVEGLANKMVKRC